MRMSSSEHRTVCTCDSWVSSRRWFTSEYRQLYSAQRLIRLQVSSRRAWYDVTAIAELHFATHSIAPAAIPLLCRPGISGAKCMPEYSYYSVTSVRSRLLVLYGIVARGERCNNLLLIDFTLHHVRHCGSRPQRQRFEYTTHTRAVGLSSVCIQAYCHEWKYSWLRCFKSLLSK